MMRSRFRSIARRLDDIERKMPGPTGAEEAAIDEDKRQLSVIAALWSIEFRRRGDCSFRIENGVRVQIPLGCSNEEGAARLEQLGVKPEVIEGMLAYPDGWRRRLAAEYERRRRPSP